jgi:hypothetical protein
MGELAIESPGIADGDGEVWILNPAYFVVVEIRVGFFL